MSFFDNFNPHKQLIAAHRGNRSERPENTHAAFQAAIGRCDFIELDIQFSKDAIPVVFHDEQLNRTSDVAEHKKFAQRKPWSICEMNLTELKELDIGSWFLHDDPFGTLRSGEVARTTVQQIVPQRIMTLEAMLSFAVQNQIPINLEVKDLSDTPHSDIAISCIVEQIYKAGVEKQVLLSSSNHDYLRESIALAPEITTGALQEKQHPESLIEYLQQLGVDAYHPKDAIVGEALMSELKTAGIAVNVFTVNDPLRKQALFKMGVRSIFTDFL